MIPSIRPEKIEELIARLHKHYEWGGDRYIVVTAAKALESLKAENERQAKWNTVFRSALDIARRDFDALLPRANAGSKHKLMIQASICRINAVTETYDRAARAFLTAQEADNG